MAVLPGAFSPEAPELAGSSGWGDYGGGDTWPIGLSLLAASLLSFLIIAALSQKSGRVWCHDFCPAGAALGLISRRSLFRTKIDLLKCTKCGRCEKGCKGGGLDSNSQAIDHSRCLACFNCLGHCRSRALSFSRARPNPGANGENKK